ncbi:putative polysaccharide-binding protein [Phytophthora ramorum]|uniref:CBM1 domain-containing protein n=1 Tax=Phytophthora ramorum TaxID=164328 RepID=H3GEX9_PHYRM|nr:putative polysaccharide-binding protein [Phytophthora ramorum]
MTKVSTVLAFAAVAVALTATDNASASYVRRLDVQDSGSDDSTEGSGEDSASSDSMYVNELPDAEDDAVPKFGQCGGIGYVGNAKCARGYVCAISDPWYAQCLPADATTLRPTKKRSHRSKVLADEADLLVEVASDEDNVFVVPAWEQCGGKGVDFDFSRDDSLDDDEETPMLSCEEGYHCQVINKWYYQCQPLSKLTGINLWEQCGGLDYKGATECTTGAVCKYFNDWYSQCVPKEQEFS